MQGCKGLISNVARTLWKPFYNHKTGCDEFLISPKEWIIISLYCFFSLLLFFFFLVVFESVVLNVYLLSGNCDVCGFARGFTFLWGFVTFTQENDNS